MCVRTSPFLPPVTIKRPSQEKHTGQLLPVPHINQEQEQRESIAMIIAMMNMNLTKTRFLPDPGSIVLTSLLASISHKRS